MATPNLDEMYADLQQADAAGDKELATAIAGRIKEAEAGGAELAQAGPKERFNLMQRRMGLGKQGDTMEKIRDVVDNAGYNAGGFVTDKTGSPELGYVANVAVDAVPAVLGGEPLVALKGLKTATQGMARKLMQSAMKPTTQDLMAGKATRAVETMLKEGVDATPGGIAKLRANIDDLKGQVDAAIEKYPMTNIQKDLITKHMGDIFEKYSKQLNPKSDKATIQKVMDEFLSEWSGNIPLKLAQEIKQGTYASLGNKSYGMNIAPAAERDALKMGALGLKEAIEQAAPEVAPLNARMSELINAGNVGLRRTMQDANKNPLGLTWLAENPAAALAFAAERNPWIKSKLAHYLYSGGAARNVGQTAGGILGTMSGMEP